MYHPRRTHHVTITPPLRQNNVAMTFGVIMTLSLRHLYVIYMTLLHVAPYTHSSNMPFCINNNHLNQSNLTFAHGNYIGLLAMIMLPIVARHNPIIISTPTPALLDRFTRFYNTFNNCSKNFAMLYLMGFIHKL